MPHLVHKSTRQLAVIGEQVTDFRGDKGFITGWQEPRNPASTGRVYVTESGHVADASGYYPSVWDLEWEGRTDRA